MNRNAVGILALVVLASLFAGPGYRSPSATGSGYTGQTVEAGLDVRESSAKKETENPCGTGVDSFQNDLFTTIQVAFSRGPVINTNSKGQKPCAGSFEIPRDNISQTHVVFAIVPDPVNTNLSLFFDRQVEALEQAAQDSNWIFSTAFLPWDNKDHPESTDFRVRRAQEKNEEEKQAQPGLLIFRRSSALSNLGAEPSAEEKLLVFVVGETPTSGVHKPQFHHAIEIMKRLFANGKLPTILAILGPTFSGSMDSLSQLLDCSESRQYPCGPAQSFFVYSGSVTDCFSGELFKQNLLAQVTKKLMQSAEFQTLHEYDDNAIAQFLRFVTQQRGYAPDEIAILSEDETLYGAHMIGTTPASSLSASICNTAADQEGVVHLYFPREISQLRSAYQRATGAEAQLIKTPGAPLPLDLQSTGTNTDSVPVYAHAHTPLSQEAVLIAIVTELKRHAIRLLLLRATDPLDKLFLSRYLRGADPQARIITLGSDLLFGRETEGALRGVMALTTYTLAPGADHQFSAQRETVHTDRDFPSSASVGTYNAMKLLLAKAVPPPVAGDRENHGGVAQECKSFPNLHLAQYGVPASGSGDGGKEGAPGAPVRVVPSHPPVHLTVLGRDSFWDVAVLPSQPHPPSMLTALWRRFVSGEAPEISSSPSEVIHSSLPLVCDVMATGGSQSPTGTKSSNRKPPGDWQLFWMIALGMSLAYSYCVWTASVLSSSQAIAHLAPPMSDSRLWLFVISGYLHFALLISLLWVFEYYPGTNLESAVLGLTIALVVLVSTLDLRRRRCPRAWLFPTLCVFTLVGIIYVWRADYIDYMFVLRAANLTSGVSPLLPILLLLFAGLWGTWYTLSGTSLIGTQRPILPGLGVIGGTGVHPEFVKALRGIRDEDLCGLLQTLRPNYMDARTGMILGLVVAAALNLAGSVRPVRTLEMRGYEYLLAFFLTIIFIALVSSCIRLTAIWSRLRPLLTTLDQAGLPRAFRALKGFSWSPLWRFGVGSGSMLEQLLRREDEAFHSMVNLGVRGLRGTQEELDRRDGSLSRKYDEAMKNAQARECWQLLRWLLHWFRPAGMQDQRVDGPLEWFRGIRRQGRLEFALVNRYRHVQEIYAKAGLQALAFAAEQWSKATDSSFDGERSSKLSKIVDSIRRTRAELESSRAAERVRAQLDACERFIALLYTVFILVVLLRIRNLALAIGGMYVFFLLAFSIYPFQPQVSIRLWMMALLALIVITVTVVFAQMHKDPTLSNLTDTRPGQLGVDFWIRTLGFAVLPVLSLVASQFPQVGSWLNSWLQPAVNALK